MGTISDKLHWLVEKRDTIVNNINYKYFSANKPIPFPNTPDLSQINHELNYLTRRRLIPVMTMYMPYSYGTYNSITAYYPMKYYNWNSQPWINNLIDNSRCMYAPYDLGLYGPQAPILTRDGEGIITGTMPTHDYTNIATFNQPFVIGRGIWNHMNNQSLWMEKGAYANLSYYYPNNRNFKVLTADDSTRNDSQFILGNIAYIDPLLYPSVKNDAMVCLINTKITNGTSNSRGYSQSYDYGTAPSIYYSSTNITTITINYGYNNFAYIWPIVTGELINSGYQAGLIVSIKSIYIYATQTVIEVATNLNNINTTGSFRLIVYAKK